MLQHEQAFIQVSRSTPIPSKDPNDATSSDNSPVNMVSVARSVVTLSAALLKLKVFSSLSTCDQNRLSGMEEVSHTDILIHQDVCVVRE